MWCDQKNLMTIIVFDFPHNNHHRNVKNNSNYKYYLAGCCVGWKNLVYSILFWRSARLALASASSCGFWLGSFWFFFLFGLGRRRGFSQLWLLGRLGFDPRGLLFLFAFYNFSGASSFSGWIRRLLRLFLLLLLLLLLLWF